MIKINLLPHVTRKKAAVNRRAQLAGLGSVVVVLVLLSAWWYMVSASRELRIQVERTQQELKRYEEVAKKVAQFEADKKRLEHLWQNGVKPGTNLKIQEVAPWAGTITTVSDGRMIVLGLAAAGKIWVYQPK
jgi:Fe2+ transport system protein FeoA